MSEAIHWKPLATAAAVLAIGLLSQGIALSGTEGQAAPRTTESVDPQACMACLRSFDLGACHRAAVNLAESGGLDRALVLQSMIHERAPRNPEFATTLGRLFYDAKNLPRALEMYHTALAVSSGYPQALMGLGMIMQDRGETAIAARYYSRAVRENPDAPDYKIALAEVLVGDGRLRDARPLLMEIVKRWPDSRHASVAQGMMSRTALAKP